MRRSDRASYHQIALEKRMPLSSGLGSSAASAVATVTAANILAGKPLSPRDLLPITMEAERVACGSAHADDVAPSLLGGFGFLSLSLNQLLDIMTQVEEKRRQSRKSESPGNGASGLFDSVLSVGFPRPEDH